MSKADIVRTLDLDTTTYRCPCGEQWDTGDPGDANAWVKRHAQHSSGWILEHFEEGSERTAIEKWLT